jgi:ferredoxin
MPFRVTIDRDGCISCGACWTDCPEFFEENEDDGLSQVVESYRTDESLAVGEAPDDLEDCVTEAAEDCPVDVIDVTPE